MEKIEQIYESASKDFKAKVQGIKGFPKDIEELTIYLLVRINTLVYCDVQEMKNETVQKILLCKQFALSATIANKIEDKRKNFENSMFQSALR